MRAAFVTIALILLLTTSCVSSRSVDQKEQLLKQDLYTVRNAIDQFMNEKGYEPQSLEDLVKAGYLREIPIDPFAQRQSDQRDWDIIWADSLITLDLKRPGIVDVHSRSKKISSKGTLYSTW